MMCLFLLLSLQRVGEVGKVGKVGWRLMEVVRMEASQTGGSEFSRMQVRPQAPARQQGSQQQQKQASVNCRQLATH